MKLFRLRNHILFYLFIYANTVYGSIEPAISSYMYGKNFINYAGNQNYTPVPVFSNALSGYSTSTPYSFPAGQQVRKIDNMLELYLDPDNITYINFPYNLEVQVGIVKNEYGANTFTTDVVTLKINYDPKERTKWVEKADYHFNNSGRVGYKILSVSLTSPNPLTDLDKAAVAEVVGLRSDIIIERYFSFNVHTPLTGLDIWNSYSISDNELSILWQAISGAEYYDLEWTYVDDYKDVNQKIPVGQLLLNKHYNLNRNSTRVQLTQNKYTLPLVFESGYILYRVRGVGIEYDPVPDIIYQMPGRWSNPVNNSPTGPEQAIDVSAWNHRYHISAPFENDQLNWQITTSYAEEGKSKSIVGFGDGTQRNRQTITGLSTGHETMVAE
ncbi:MAG TPA: hypothetical protein VK590_02770, partial [Saprospiraceae bacterium]|nr:hypothetical protein [Saprospiraceae bacterium]